jgi:transcriptional regulator with XRE-family HTH domain
MRMVVKAQAPAKTFGARVRQLRHGKGFIQGDLAKKVAERLKQHDNGRLSASYLSKIESEQFGPPSEAAIVDLAAVLEADTDELLALAGRAPIGFEEKLKRSPATRAFFKWAMEELTEDDWNALLSQMRHKDGKADLS